MNNYLIRYTYTESDVSEECGFLCKAESMRAAAEKFWNQHPGECFKLVSINNGSIEAFWASDSGQFVTIPDKE